MANTERDSQRLLRLPLWIGIDANQVVEQFARSVHMLN